MRPTALHRALAPALLAALLCAAPAPAGAAQEPPLPPIMAPTPTGRPAAKKPAPKRPDTPVTVRMTPKVWKRATYSFEGRVETGVGDVTFVAPPAYRESFAFWGDRMKGSSRTEMMRHLTTTRDPAADGGLPFRRQVSRYLIDMLDHGQVMAAGGPFMKDVSRMAWEGSLDAQGNVREIKMVVGPEDTEAIDRLAFPLLDHLFPRLEGPRAIATGESFTEERTMPLPSKLSITGLEATAARLTRRYTLREVRGNEAIFDVAAIYAPDPATPPTAPRTTCVITGGGKGEAVFDLAEGMFIKAEQATRLIIDVEAPLRRLPDQPADADPGTATSHMEINLSLSGSRTVARLFEDDPAPPDPVPEPALE